MPIIRIMSVIMLGVMVSCNPVAGGKSASYFGPDFNPGVAPTPTATPDPQVTVGAVNGFKMTTGAQGMVGSAVSAQTTILPNDRKLIGGNISGRFSINKTQVR